MWIRTHRQVYQGVNKEDVWAILTDINHWADWHDDLESCKLENTFAVGQFFRLKPKGGPSVRIELIEIEEGRKLTDCTHFFGARMTDIHELEETPEGLAFKNTLMVTGPLKWLWIKLVADNVAKTVPAENDTLVQLARRRHG